MRKFIIERRMLVMPFNEPARDLMVLQDTTKVAPLRIQVTDLVERVIGKTSLELDLDQVDQLEMVLEDEIELARKKGRSQGRVGVDPYDKIVVYADNLYFDEEFFTYFWERARKLGGPCQAALVAGDAAWEKYSVPLTSLVRETFPIDRADFDLDGVPNEALVYDEYGNLQAVTGYTLELYYFPSGWSPRSDWHMIVIPSEAKEVGYYNVPDSMGNIKLDHMTEGLEAAAPKNGRPTARKEGDLTHYLTARTCVPIQSWVHLFNLGVPMGVFSRGGRFEEKVNNSNVFSLKVFLRAIIEQKQILHCSELVKVGKNCDIDPTAVIVGPTTIGDNCKIGPGVVVDNCVVGDNVTLANNAHIMLSVVGDNCFLPFRAALFMSVLMENTIVAQNACLQMCVVGRNSFVGSGTTFTDFNLLPSPLRALDAYGEMGEVRQPVIGGAVGHNVRVGAGMVIMPGRYIESDVILVPGAERRIINKSISYDMSDHHTLGARAQSLHRRLYPPLMTMREEEFLEEWGS